MQGGIWQTASTNTVGSWQLARNSREVELIREVGKGFQYPLSDYRDKEQCACCCRES